MKRKKNERKRASSASITFKVKKQDVTGEIPLEAVARADSHGKIHHAGQPLRAITPWAWGKTTRPNGDIIAGVIPPFSTLF
jgi:hypothetical protein